MEIQHFSHKHPLRLRDDEINVRVSCKICYRPVTTAPLYACDSCRYYLHKSCAELPQQINHSFHPSHPLTLLTRRNYYCNSCGREFDDAPSYKCIPCDFDMDVECALMPVVAPTSSSEGQQSIQHYSHPHSLLLVATDDKHQIKCVVCNSRCSSGKAYGCTKCDFFLDESCAELPRQIRHPLHPHYGLLSLFTRSAFTCSVCKIYMHKRYNFTFECRQCKFQMCVKCSKIPIRRNFKYEDHEHLLCFVEKMRRKIRQCNGYDSYCAQPVASSSKEFNCTQDSVFICLDCDFSLHLLCGLLPSIIKHECHVDPLTLVDSVLEDDSGEYYCDVCETERDPRIRFYCCMDCKYFAHVHCVVSEIKTVLMGEVENHVEHKTIGQDIWKVPHHHHDDQFIVLTEQEQGKSAVPLTLKDLINELLTEEERKNLGWYYRWDEKSSNKDEQEKQDDSNRDGSSTQDNKLLGDEEINDILQLSRFARDEFQGLFSELQDFWLENNLELKSSDLALKIVKVKGGYMIPHSLSDVMQTLTNQYGDIGSGSNETLAMKSFVYFILCQVVRRMRSTMVKDITKALLREWYYHLIFVRWNGGFKIDFACAQLEEVVHAFFAFQAKRLQEEIPTILIKKITELQQQLENKIAALQKQLDKCKEYNGPSAKSEYMTYCFNKASELEWRHAFEGFSTEKDGMRLISNYWW